MVMAENKTKKKNWFLRTGSKIGKFFKGIALELKNVTWPTKRQVVTNTISVLIFCLVVGAIIWLSDLGLQYLMKAIALIQ